MLHGVPESARDRGQTPLTYELRHRVYTSAGRRQAHLGQLNVIELPPEGEGGRQPVAFEPPLKVAVSERSEKGPLGELVRVCRGDVIEELPPLVDPLPFHTPAAKGQASRGQLDDERALNQVLLPYEDSTRPGAWPEEDPLRRCEGN